MKRWIAVVLLGLVMPVFLGAGCATSPAPPDARIVYLDKKMPKKLSVYVTSRQVQDLAEVVIQFQKVRTKDTPLDVQYKVTWVDQNGLEVEPEKANWKPAPLNGFEPKQVNDIAPNPRAVDFRVYVKWM